MQVAFSYKDLSKNIIKKIELKAEPLALEPKQKKVNARSNSFEFLVPTKTNSRLMTRSEVMMMTIIFEKLVYICYFHHFIEKLTFNLSSLKLLIHKRLLTSFYNVVFGCQCGQLKTTVSFSGQ